MNSSRMKPLSIRASPSDVFSTTLPTKPSQTTTSVVPSKMSLPSTLPIEVQTAAAQQLGRLLDRVVALDHFLADVQQADRRALVAFEHARQRRPHHRELQEVVGVAVDVRAEVEHQVVTPPR